MSRVTLDVYSNLNLICGSQMRILCLHTVFAEFHRGDLPSAVVSLIDGSGNRKGYFQSQSEVVRELQLAKSYTLAYQLNRKEQPLIDINGLSSSKVPVVFGYGENTRDLLS